MVHLVGFDYKNKYKIYRLFNSQGPSSFQIKIKNLVTHLFRRIIFRSEERGGKSF
jgi:hypothetical protein